MHLLPLLTLLTATSSPLEDAAAQHVRREYERVGRRAPTADPKLSSAAQRLARQALATSASDAAAPGFISEAVSDAAGHDPSPKVLVVRGAPARAALDSLLARRELSEEPASHFGVASASSPSSDRTALVLMLSQRRTTLLPFPRALHSAGAAQTLCGALVPPLSTAEVYVTRPSGTVERLPLSREEGQEYCASIPLSAPGRYAIEVIGRGPRGPEVAALFFTDVAVAEGPRAARGRRAPEPSTVEAARQAVFEEVNALRRRHGVSPVRLDPALSDIAQAYSDRMAKENFFAHVAPDGQDLRGRLRAAGYAYLTAGENLGMAPGPLAAHEGIELSPGHRKNLLDPAHRTLGVGVTFQEQNGRPQVIVTEVLANPSVGSEEPAKDTYATIARRRAALRLPALVRDETLERIARDHAAKALALGEPKSQLPTSVVHERVFAELSEVSTASVDFFVAEAPSLITESKNLSDAKNSLVGVGAVRGDSERYGKAKYWVVVIYAAHQK